MKIRHGDAELEVLIEGDGPIVMLLAADGRVPIPGEIIQALRSSFDNSLAEDERLAAIGLAFFAEGHDPAIWRDGWHAEVAAAILAWLQES